MSSKLTEGFTIGHWTNLDAATGCSVILCPPGTVASCDVRGSSPGSRELALLSPTKTMQEVHALLLTGGSAFGLSAADGVMQYLEENNVGYQTPWIRVPIVPAAVIFDLNVGASNIRPDSTAGHIACKAAKAPSEEGSVGAGTGATVGKWNGLGSCMKGGVGIWSEQLGSLVVSVVAVVNAVGDIMDESMNILAGARTRDGDWVASADPLRQFAKRPVLNANTTLVAVMTNARLTKVQAHRVAERTHDGMARAIRPVHTSYDGDIAFTLASGAVETTIDLVSEMACAATERSIRRAVIEARSVAGITALSDIVSQS